MDFDSDTDVSSDSELQAELTPTTDPESPTSLDLTGGAEWTTEDYLENTQVWELSTTWNQTPPALWKEPLRRPQ